MDSSDLARTRPRPHHPRGPVAPPPMLILAPERSSSPSPAGAPPAVDSLAHGIPLFSTGGRRDSCGRTGGGRALCSGGGRDSRARTGGSRALCGGGGRDSRGQLVSDVASPRVQGAAAPAGDPPLSSSAPCSISAAAAAGSVRNRDRAGGHAHAQPRRAARRSLRGRPQRRPLPELPHHHHRRGAL
ncbi:hypothetical protein BRADI_4g28229v3 [Brachypodium distachyon]|uniref:Uncharacterized protein n=1 Tax=Brachypodium distachyon TaxID=15368 RepID=A0A0Q3LBI1_BRADI|nr:hypothetical protein BRADI_4g28229v3 [Brachypodium distachyon]